MQETESSPITAQKPKISIDTPSTSLLISRGTSTSRRKWFETSLRIQPPLIRSRYYVRNAAGANERRLYSQASLKQAVLVIRRCREVAVAER